MNSYVCQNCKRPLTEEEVYATGPLCKDCAADSKTVELALGRIFRLMSRQPQPGDVAEYERCRALILDRCEPVHSYAPNYVRDRLLGAAGD